MDRQTGITLVGGSYGLFGIGVGLAVASWGTSVGWSILSGLFWPVTLAYWLIRALHKAAGG